MLYIYDRCNIWYVYILWGSMYANRGIPFYTQAQPLLNDWSTFHRDSLPVEPLHDEPPAVWFLCFGTLNVNYRVRGNIRCFGGPVGSRSCCQGMDFRYSSITTTAFRLKSPIFISKSAPACVSNHRHANVRVVIQWLRWIAIRSISM